MTREIEKPPQTPVLTKLLDKKNLPWAGDVILSQSLRRNITVLLHQMISHLGSKPRTNQLVLSPSRKGSLKGFRLLCTSNCLLVIPDRKYFQ